MGSRDFLKANQLTFWYGYVFFREFINFASFSFCDIRCHFRINTIFGSSVAPVVCRMVPCSIYVIRVCLRIVVSNTYCVVSLFCSFLLCILCCQFFWVIHLFLVPPLVFSKFYLNGDNFYIINKRIWYYVTVSTTSRSFH